MTKIGNDSRNPNGDTMPAKRYTWGMFTGIVETAGRVAAVTDQPAGKRLVIDPGDWLPRNGVFSDGDSICVSGVCLTLVTADGGKLAFDVIQETLDKSRLGALTEGSRANLESSLTASTAMGGHFVQGHVDGTGTVLHVQSGDDWRVTIQTPKGLERYIVPKGSITVDGVSMTLAEVSADSFVIALIPTTLEVTTLSDLKPGDPVNLEADIMVKTIVHYLDQVQSGNQPESGNSLTMQTLLNAGFVGDEQASAT